MKHFNCVFLFVFIGFSSAAQIVKGIVVDKAGIPIPTVNVYNLASKSTVATDFDGKFAITAGPNDALKFSMIGYTSLTVIASKALTVVLQEMNTRLDDVVVVGYGTKKKGAITGSVVQIKSDDILKTPAQ